jgi:hypothetical protein
MPRGAKPGTRNGGGSKKGQKYRKTIEREILAERVMNEAAMSGKKLGKEVLEEFMVLFMGVAAKFQPTAPTEQALQVWAKSANEPMFEKYAKLALKAASDLAAYQSPKLAAVQVVAPPPERGAVKKRFTVGIFDGQGRPAPRHIDVVATTSVTKPAKGTNGAGPSKLN